MAFLSASPPRRRGGPGRRPTRPGSWVQHRPRPWHDANHPVHVTLKVRAAVPSLRGFRLAKVIQQGLRVASSSPARPKQERRKTFRVVHFSIQPNHLHLIVEATSKTALSRGMQGLASGLARRVNRKLERRGSLFADRYHAHAMSGPTEVRNAIVYVLKNYEKHPVARPDIDARPIHGVDPCSSAPWFEHWAESWSPGELAPPSATEAPAVAAPQTWLLRAGWRRLGLISREERPAQRPGGAWRRRPSVQPRQ
jgi:REP element-mobilizing transposase RayT